jgi:SpoVK/Ycf46/Vps4 family AAA+-type ATPase
MPDLTEIRQDIEYAVSDTPSDGSFQTAQRKLMGRLGLQPEYLIPAISYVLTGWRTEYGRCREFETALEEARNELQKIQNGGLVGGLYIGESGSLPHANAGSANAIRKVLVACRGSVLEVPLTIELESVILAPGRSFVFLDQQCRLVTRIAESDPTTAFGRSGTITHVLSGRRAYVQLEDGRGDIIVELARDIDDAKLRPDESRVRIIDITENFRLAVEVLPEDDAADGFADGLTGLPPHSRADVIGQDRAWEEIDKLLLRSLRNPRGVDLYNLDGRNGALARSRGLFIAGPPGVGKSMLVAAALREVEGATGKPVLLKSITGSYFSSRWFGESEHRALSLYHRMSSLAKQRNQTPVVMIDEAGPAFVRRSAGAAESGGTQAHSDLTNTFLHIIGSTDVITIAIDNNPTAIDPAILRPGRLPLVRADRPGYRHCVEIARRNLARTLVASDESAESLAIRLCDLVFLGEQFQDLLKIRFVGGTQRTYSGKDLITGADIVEGIVTPAAEKALQRDESAGAMEADDFQGVGWNDLRTACLQRFNTLIRNIDRTDAGEYVDIPEGKVIQSVERKNLALI